MPPGYGYLTRHLRTRQLTLGEAVQIADRRVLVLEMRKKTRLHAKNTYMFRPRQPNEQTLALKVPLQTELQFHLRGYKQPPTLGGPRGDKAPGRSLQQQRQRPLLRVAELQQQWPQGGRCCNNALAHVYARGARTSTKSRRPGARMVAVIPSATRTSPAAATSAPTTGAVCPPADPHSNPPGRAEHRPPRRGAVPGQR
jgi:hypothetical protein